MDQIMEIAAKDDMPAFGKKSLLIGSDFQVVVPSNNSKYLDLNNKKINNNYNQ